MAVVTPVWTHFELAKTALENGKHVFVEKPFTCTTAQGEELIELADRKNLKIMVDHTFLFTGAVKRMKEMIDDGTLGDLYYYDSTRVNLGLFQHDVNVLWDLAPHDLSIMDYLIKEKPEDAATTTTHSAPPPVTTTAPTPTVTAPAPVVAPPKTTTSSPPPTTTTGPQGYTSTNQGY